MKRGRSTIWNEEQRGYCVLHSGVPKRHRLKSIYQHMLSRCYNPTDRNYMHYGGRGIRVCSRWFYSFEAFAHDMGKRKHRLKGRTMDRIDVNGNYSPENCRWADWITQANNRTNNITHQQIENIKAVRSWGVSYRGIASLLSLSYGAVYKHAKDVIINHGKPTKVVYRMAG